MPRETEKAGQGREKIGGRLCHPGPGRAAEGGTLARSRRRKIAGGFRQVRHLVFRGVVGEKPAGLGAQK